MGQPNLKIFVPLNIQRFGGNSVSVSAYETWVDINANTSYVHVIVKCSTNSSTYNTSTGWVNVSASGTHNSYSTGNSYVKYTKSMSSKTIWEGDLGPFNHNSDGSLSAVNINVSTYITKTTKPSASTSCGMSTIPRYFSQTPSIWVASRTETSTTFGWSTSETCNWVRYHLDGSGGWTDVFSGSGTSGSFTINGLGANSSHNVYIECRRQDSGLWSNSGTLGFNTLDYPYCNSSPNFTIGESVTLGFYNPLGRNINISILDSNDNVLATDSTTGTSKSGFNSSVNIENYYNSIPNSKSGIYKVKVIYGGSTKIRNNGNTYSVNQTDCKPIFNNFTFADVNPITTALTGNDQVCISGYSNIKATIAPNNKATAQKNATMSYYRLVIGNKNDQQNYSDEDNVYLQVNNAPNGVFSVYAADSRDVSTEVQQISQSQIDYEDIIRTIDMTAKRVNDQGVEVGLSEKTKITLSGKYWKENFGNVINSITEVSYKYRKTTDAEYTTGITQITLTEDEDGYFTFSGNIKGDADNGFGTANSYEIVLTIRDELSSVEYTAMIGSGIPHIAYARDGISIMGKYDEEAGGPLQINGIPIKDYLNRNV